MFSAGKGIYLVLLRQVLIAFAFSAGQAFSQIFGLDSNGVPPLVYNSPAGLSTACNETFGTPIRCSPLLPMIAWEGYFPSVNDLRLLCNTGCLQSLGSFRNNQLASCGSDVETVAGTAYPATYNVDYFIFTYNYTCRTDRYIFFHSFNLLILLGAGGTPYSSIS